MLITTVFTIAGLALFTGQILWTEFRSYWRHHSAEFDRDFGTCDKVFPPFKLSNPNY